MNRVNLESAIIVAYEHSSTRRCYIDQYLDQKGIDEEFTIEDCLEQISEKEVNELFIKIFN